VKNDRLIPLVSGILLCLIFGVSLFLFVRYQKNWHRYVLFFPQYRDEKVIETEFRKFPMKESAEENMYSLIQEILLGPEDLRHIAIMPEETQLQSLLFRNGELFVDFSSELLFSGETPQLSLREKIFLIEKALRFNFREIEEIVFTIEGELPRAHDNS
jgi:hypothetical protein